MTLNCVYITLCMHVCVYILCVCARSPPVICPSAPWAVYCDAVSLLFDGWQTITRCLILWLIICTISYRSTHTHTDTHCSRLSSQSFRQRTHKDTVMCLFDFSPSSFIVCCLCLRWSAVFLPWSSFKSLAVSVDLSSFKSTTRNLNSWNGCLSFTYFERKMHILVKWRTFWQETVVLMPTLSTEATTINKNGSSWQLL